MTDQRKCPEFDLEKLLRLIDEHQGLPKIVPFDDPYDPKPNYACIGGKPRKIGSARTRSEAFLDWMRKNL